MQNIYRILSFILDLRSNWTAPNYEKQSHKFMELHLQKGFDILSKLKLYKARYFCQVLSKSDSWQSLLLTFQKNNALLIGT